jgi:hypothetical protein
LQKGIFVQGAFDPFPASECWHRPASECWHRAKQTRDNVRAVLGSLGSESKPHLRKHPFFSQKIHIFKANSGAKFAFFAFSIANLF